MDFFLAFSGLAKEEIQAAGGAHWILAAGFPVALRLVVEIQGRDLTAQGIAVNAQVLGGF